MLLLPLPTLYMLEAPEGGLCEGAGSGTVGGFGETSRDDTPEEDDGAEWSSGLLDAYGRREDMDEVEVREKREAEVEADGGPDDSVGA